jgi:hypothetical protein
VVSHAAFAGAARGCAPPPALAARSRTGRRRPPSRTRSAPQTCS